MGGLFSGVTPYVAMPYNRTNRKLTTTSFVYPCEEEFDGCKEFLTVPRMGCWCMTTVV